MAVQAPAGAAEALGAWLRGACQHLAELPLLSGVLLDPPVPLQPKGPS